MKKIFWISGIIALLLLLLLLTGIAGADGEAKKALNQGNAEYNLTKYKEALNSYETGLGSNPENQILNLNAAQAAFALGEYDKAIEYYGKAKDSLEKFLNAGNICYWAGEAVEEPEQKVQFYGMALEIYLEGITKYPENVPLKYNFETVKEKLEELLEDMEQENSGESEDGESQEGEEQESEGAEAAEGEEEEQNSSEAESSEAAEGEEQEGAEDEQEAGSPDEDEEEDPDWEAIERILRLLESQEEEGLKNNQEVKQGNNGKGDW
ncbi:MAG: tetratricopeptide repeat protein [Clostridiales bacterium]|nr:tetratricopeptide repeat protein [Clostridiales bacterium]MDR2713732.1 tetratricopeptide repeat protein [Clostridiales bacterium]